MECLGKCIEQSDFSVPVPGPRGKQRLLLRSLNFVQTNGALNNPQVPVHYFLFLSCKVWGLERVEER